VNLGMPLPPEQLNSRFGSSGQVINLTE